MHVAYVLPSLAIGGMEQFVVLLGTELVRAGHRATVICTQLEGELAEIARADGVQIVFSPFASRWDNLRPTRLVRDIAGVAPDLLHSQNGVWLPAALAARKLGIPMCHTEHGIQSMHEPFKVTSQKYVAARLTHAVVAVSTGLQTQLSRRYHVPEGRLSRIDNGIPIERYAPNAAVRAEVRHELEIPDDTIVIGAVARLHHLKGIDRLMEAAQAMSGLGRAVRIVVAGDGEDRALVESHATGAAVPVQLLGMRNDVHRLMQAFDIFVLPSRSEGLPLAVLEAMAAGCAIVATDVGEVASVLADEAGIVVPRGDVAALAAALMALVRDDHGRKKLAANALRAVGSRYSISRMAKTYLRLYRRLVTSTSSR